MIFIFLIGSLLIQINAQKDGENNSINLQKQIDVDIPHRAEMMSRDQGFSSRRGSPFIDDRRSRIMDIDLERDRREYNDRSRRLDRRRDQQIELDRRREIERDRTIEMERRREIERDREIEIQRKREIEREEDRKRKENQQIEAKLEQSRQQEQHEEINREVSKALDKRKELKRLANSKTDFILNRSDRQNNANRGEVGRRQDSWSSNWKEDKRDVRHINPRGDRNKVEQEAKERENARIQAERNQEQRDRLRNNKYNDKKSSNVEIDQNIEESRRGESRVLFNDNIRKNRDDIIDHYKVTGDRKAPILILEQVEVPVPVPVTALGGGERSVLPSPGLDTRSSGHGDRNIWFGSGPDDLDRRPARLPFQAGVPPGTGYFPDGYGHIPLDQPFPPFDPTHGFDEFHVHTIEEGGIRDPRLIGPILPPPNIAEQLHLQQIAIQNQVGQALLVDQALKQHVAGAAAAAGAQQAVAATAAAGAHQAAAATAAIGVQQAAAADAAATKLQAVRILKNALKNKIKEKLKHNLEVASVVAGQNAIRKQHATDLAVALHHVPQDPTNLALHIAEVKHHYDKTRKELLRRLILLKPYFLRSGSLEYTMPSSLPNLPNGVLNLTPLQVQQLPLVPIKHPLTLVGPAFHLPNSLRGRLGPTIDEKYIEYILKLPDHIFRVITHMNKREFVDTLFPRLYLENLRSVNSDTEKVFESSLHDIESEKIQTNTFDTHINTPLTLSTIVNSHKNKPSYTENSFFKVIPDETPTDKLRIITDDLQQKPNIYTTPKSIILPISDHNSKFPMPLYPPHDLEIQPKHNVLEIHPQHVGLEIQPKHQTLPSVLQVTTPVPLGEHHTTTIHHQGNFGPVVTSPPDPVVVHGVHIRPQGHPLTDHPHALIPVTEQHVIHITTPRPPLSPIAPLIPSPQDIYAPPIVSTQVPITTTYQPIITTTNPPISTAYNHVITTTYNPPIPTVYNPVITTPYNPPIPTVYNPVITTTHNPPIPTVYNPIITTTQSPPTSTIYNPVVTTTYNPPVTTPFDPITASYLPADTTPNINPFFPINTSPVPRVTTTFQPPFIANTAAPPFATSIQPALTTPFEEFPDASDIPDFFRPIEEIPINPNAQFEELELDDFEIDRQRPLGTDSHDDSHRFPLFVKRQGDSSSMEVKHHFRIPNLRHQNGQPQFHRRTPMPKQIGPNGLPFKPLSHRRIPGAVPQNPPQPRPITEADLARLPAYLRKAPPCASNPTNRSFCLMPDEYPTETANTIAKNYDRELRELRSILQHLPPIEFDLEKAAGQFPNINKNIKCESEERTVVLSWSRDVLGSWFTIFQTAPLQQEITVTTCSATAKSLGCRPLLRPRPLVAFHPRDKEPRPLVFEFPMPIACVAVTSDLHAAASASSVKVVEDPKQQPTTFSALNRRLGITTTQPLLNKELTDNETQPSFNLFEIQHSTPRSSHSLESSTRTTIITFNIPIDPLDHPPSARQPKSLPDVVQDNLQIDLIPTAMDEEEGRVIDLPPSINESIAIDPVSGGNIYTSNFHFILILLIIFVIY